MTRRDATSEARSCSRSCSPAPSRSPPAISSAGDTSGSIVRHARRGNRVRGLPVLRGKSSTPLTREELPRYQRHAHELGYEHRNIPEVAQVLDGRAKTE